MRAALFSLLTLAACGPVAAPDTSPAPSPWPEPLAAFPRVADDGDGMRLQALGAGRLIVENGCLRLDGGTGSRLIVWTPTATPQPGQPLRVFDPTTGFGVGVGDQIVIGGGAVDGVQQDGLEAPIPAECAGPYWLAAEGFHPAPESDWRTYDATGAFTIRIPANVTKVPVQGIDSAVDELRAPGLTMMFDYGAFNCSDPAPQAGERHVRSMSYVDRRPVTFDRFRREGEDRPPERVRALFSGLEYERGAQPDGRLPLCLAVEAACESDRQCDMARAMISTIRFDED